MYWSKHSKISRLVLQSQITAYVPNSVVKYVLGQRDVEGKRGKWIEKIQEYDLDIKN